MAFLFCLARTLVDVSSRVLQAEAGAVGAGECACAQLFVELPTDRPHVHVAGIRTDRFSAFNCAVLTKRGKLL